MRTTSDVIHTRIPSYDRPLLEYVNGIMHYAQLIVKLLYLDCMAQNLAALLHGNALTTQYVCYVDASATVTQQTINNHIMRMNINLVETVDGRYFIFFD